jgi:hypothetical protein
MVNSQLSTQTTAIVEIVLRDLKSHGLSIKLGENDSTSITGSVKDIPADILEPMKLALKGLKPFIVAYLKEGNTSNETVGEETN